MDLNGVWASLSFPSMITGFCGRVYSQCSDPELGLAATRAWNDWMHDAWWSPHPDRIIPMGITWLSDPEVGAAEIRRNAGAGLPRRHPARAPAPDRATRRSSTTTGSRSCGPARRRTRWSASTSARPAWATSRPGCERGDHAADGHAVRPAVAHGVHGVAVVRPHRAPPRPQGRDGRGRHRLGGDAARPPRQHRRPLGLRPRVGRATRRRAAPRASGSARSTTRRPSTPATPSASRTSWWRSTTPTATRPGPTRRP